MLPRQQIAGELLVDKLLFQEKADELATEVLGHPFQIPVRQVADLLVGDYGLLTLGVFNALVTVLRILSVFFIMLGLIEDVGYLPNLGVLTRRNLGKMGLTGKSVMNLILGFGCTTMAAITTKSIPSRKEKLIAIYLIAFAIPCSAQLAIDMAILGRIGISAFVIAYGSLALVEIAAGVVLNKVIKDDDSSEYIQELPPIRRPSPKAILIKTGYRLYWFLKEAVPIFVIAALVLLVFDKLGVLDALKRGLEPFVVWMGLGMMLAINISSFILAGILHWVLVLFL